MNQKGVIVVAGMTMLAVTGLVRMLAGEDRNPGDQFRLRDFPPSPSDIKAPAYAVPKPDQMIELAEHTVNLNVASTNQDEKVLIGEIKELKTRLLAVETAANDRDPMLQVYERYVDKAHEWVMANHGREFGIGYACFTTNSAPLPKRRSHDLVALIDMALYRDLATNTNFAPLLKAVFEGYSRKSINPIASSYTRNDVLIGFQATSSAKPATSFEAYVAELNQRYDLVLAKMDQIQREEGISTEVVMGWMYGDLYRLLDGSAQDYGMLNTPDEVPKLRKQLQAKVIKLHKLQGAQ